MEAIEENFSKRFTIEEVIERRVPPVSSKAPVSENYEK
jgi:hypothetical protein